MKGLDINIKNLTNSNHFDMLSQHCKEGGDLDWTHLLNGGSQVITRKVWGATYKVTLTFCQKEKVLIAECS